MHEPTLATGSATRHRADLPSTNRQTWPRPTDFATDTPYLAAIVADIGSNYGPCTSEQTADRGIVSNR
jgi:hypothetical protein